MLQSCMRFSCILFSPACALSCRSSLLSCMSSQLACLLSCMSSILYAFFLHSFPLVYAFTLAACLHFCMLSLLHVNTVACLPSPMLSLLHASCLLSRAFLLPCMSSLLRNAFTFLSCLPFLLYAFTQAFFALAKAYFGASSSN